MKIFNVEVAICRRIVSERLFTRLMCGCEGEAGVYPNENLKNINPL